VTGVTPSPADQPSQELAGDLGVEATARRVRHYRYAEERVMRVMAGWIALTPELPAKLLLGRQVWDCAQHADQWGKRLPELRAPAQVSEPPSAEFVRFLDALEAREAWGETIERLTGVYRVLKPHLVAAYAAHLDRVNPVYEPPTRRILERCLADERRHIADGEAVLDALLRAPEVRARATAWERELRDRLDASGGVTGSQT
jgi:1,2-phenylacetyl-CoA epoxidase catalytic subunit